MLSVWWVLAHSDTPLQKAEILTIAKLYTLWN